MSEFNSTIVSEYDTSKIDDLDRDITGELVMGLKQLGYTVSLENGEINVSSSEPDVVQDVSDEVESITKPSSSNTATTLTSVLKNDSIHKINALNAQTTAIQNQNKLLKEQNDFSAKHINAITKQNTLIANLTAVLSKGVDSQTSQESALKSISNASKNDNFHNFDISSSLAQSKKYHKFMLEGSDDLVDSKGNKINPLKSKARKDSEVAISFEDENTTDYSSVATSLDDFLTLDDSNLLEDAINKFLDVDVTKIDNIGVDNV